MQFVLDDPLNLPTYCDPCKFEGLRNRAFCLIIIYHVKQTVVGTMAESVGCRESELDGFEQSKTLCISDLDVSRQLNMFVARTGGTSLWVNHRGGFVRYRVQ